MITLETGIPIIYNLILKKVASFAEDKASSVDAQLTDDDGNLYHIHNLGKDKTKIVIEMGSIIFSDAKDFDIVSKLKLCYKDYESTNPEAKYQVAFIIDLNNNNIKDGKVCATEFSLIRHRMYECLYEEFFKALSSKKEIAVLINIRDNEKMFIQSKGDRINTIFAVDFNNDEDVVFAKTFMKEYKEVKGANNRAPQVVITYNEPPSELANYRVPSGPKVGYITFIVSDIHNKADNKVKTIAALSSFLQYFKYHLKCSKAYLNKRMRDKTAEFVKVINRARPQITSTTKKTVTGKTFVRA